MTTGKGRQGWDEFLDAESTKQWLRRYLALAAEESALYESWRMLYEKVEAARTTNLSGMPRGSRNPVDEVGREVAMLAELEAELNEARSETMTVWREIRKAIRSIKGRRWGDKRAILRFRYLDGLKWEEIAETLFKAQGGTEIDYLDKSESLLKRVQVLHREALDEIEKYLDLDRRTNEDGSEELRG